MFITIPAHLGSPRQRTVKLFDAIERTLDDLGHVDVMFASSDSFVDDVVKTLGQLNLKSAGNSNYFHCKFTSVVILS